MALPQACMEIGPKTRRLTPVPGIYFEQAVIRMDTGGVWFPTVAPGVCDYTTDHFWEGRAG